MDKHAVTGFPELFLIIRQINLPVGIYPEV